MRSYLSVRLLCIFQLWPISLASMEIHSSGLNVGRGATKRGGTDLKHAMHLFVQQRAECRLFFSQRSGCT